MMRHHNTSDDLCRWAVFYVLGRLLTTLRPLFADLGLRGSLAVVVYLTGLLTQHNVTVTEIATQVGLVSHDTLRRMLQTLGVTLTAGLCLVVRLVTRLSAEPGALLIDDVLLPKPFARAIALCYWDYDHSTRRNCFGQRLVFVVWSNGKLLLPLRFAFWQKDPRRKPKKPKRQKATGKTKGPGALARCRTRRKRTPQSKRRLRLPNGVHYRTKNELAQALVWRLVRRGLPVEYVLFDNWYAAHGNFRLFEWLRLKWVTRAKGNYRVLFGGRSLTVSEVAATVQKANYHYYAGLQARARSFVVAKEGRSLTLTVIKNDRGPEGGRTKYLLTNATGLTTRQVIAWYRRRGAIEVFFRDCKQYLGLGRSEVRNMTEIISHVFLVCVAYTALQRLKPKQHEQNVSVRADKHALAPLLLLVLPTGERCARCLLANGTGEMIALAHLLTPVRTRLPALPLAEHLDFT
jgi:hypothetical protein